MIQFKEYKDGKDFLNKTGMNLEAAIAFLDEELKKLS